MPKAPRDNESTTPKKRTRKAAAPKSGNGVHADGGNGAVEVVTVTTEAATITQATTNLEEQIRIRAYELYLQRGGHGGSAEQDWLRAQQEICGRRAS